MPAQYDDYENKMNNINDDINKLFNIPHNNKISHLHKLFNDKEEKYIYKKMVLYLHF
jgi:hypothetical protein